MINILGLCLFIFTIRGILCQQNLSSITFNGDKSKFLELLPSEDEVKGSPYEKDWPMEDEIVEYLQIQKPAQLDEYSDNIFSEENSETSNPTSKKETSEPSPNPTTNPTTSSTANPTTNPTNEPSSKPTKRRTKKPTPNPSPKPSLKPTLRPTPNPTKGNPTTEPSYEKYEGYFDYKEDSAYGPDEWDEVDVSDSEYFAYFEKYDNECNGPEQSPIDVDPNVSCPDDHKINYKNGRPKFRTVDFAVLPQVLRAYLDQPEINDDDGAIYLGARADFSNLSEYIPAVHVDVKIPSEHYLFGKQYPGEMNIVHYFDKGRGRMVFITILMDNKKDKVNEQLELFIKEWEEFALQRKMECNGEKYKRTYFQPGYEELRKIWQMTDKQKGDWDVYK